MHRIRRQILELELPREAGAYALQQRVSRVFQEQVLPQLELIFDRIAPSDRYIRIERLEVNIGNLPESHWEHHFLEACVQQIIKSVETHSFELTDAGVSAASILKPEERAMDIFLCFLENGILPWYAKGMTLHALEEILMPVFKTRTPSSDTLLHSVLRRKPDALRRLALQFSPTFSQTVVETALPLLPRWISESAQISVGGVQWANDKSWLAHLYIALFQMPAGTWQQTQPTTWPTQEPAIKKILETLLLTGTPPEMKRPVVPPSKPSAGTTTGEMAGQPIFANPQKDARELLMPNATPQQQPVRTPESAPNAYGDMFSGISVEHAGLVLLGPYLPAFFGHLQLVQDNVFISEETQTKAVHLLHFLAGGQENPEEPVLTLPKILCGMALETAIPAEVILSDAEQEEATALLEAVVRNWPALKNTSAGGLREGFLQRTGQISWHESRQCWLLQVERQAQDLLLEHLPWTISVIRLPWMEGMVQVEW